MQVNYTFKNFIPGEIETIIRKRLENSQLVKSNVYDVNSAENVYTEERDSYQKEFSFENDDELKKICDNMLSYIEVETEKQFDLMKTNVTYIKYENGGHFAKHKDFPHIVSNVTKECTLVYFMNTVEDGGELILYNNGDKTHISPIKGKCVIFDKDTDHEGSSVRNGIKEILVFDVIRKTHTNNIKKVETHDYYDLYTGCDSSYELKEHCGGGIPFSIDIVKGCNYHIDVDPYDNNIDTFDNEIVKCCVGTHNLLNYLDIINGDYCKKFDNLDKKYNGSLIIYNNDDDSDDDYGDAYYANRKKKE